MNLKGGENSKEYSPQLNITITSNSSQKNEYSIKCLMQKLCLNED